LFDFGGVFTESPFLAAERFAAELGAAPSRLLEVVFGPYHEDTDHPWHRLERGELALDDARAEIVALGAEIGLDSDPYRVLAALAGTGTRDAFVRCVEDLRARGYATAIVTNNAREFRDVWRAMLPVAELFDAVIDSSEVGLRKPDPRIYRLALRALGDVAAERAIYLDDYPANVDAAVRLGMHGIVVGPDPAPALAELQTLTADRAARDGG